MVTVYSTPNCVRCNLTKKVMSDKGVEFREVDLSTDPESMALVKSLGYTEAPVVMAGTEHWSGFIPARIEALAA